MKIFYSLIGGRLPGQGPLRSGCVQGKPIELTVEEKVETLEDLEEQNQRYSESKDPWALKLGIINGVLRSSWIKAAAFIPSNPDLLQVLYLQKGPGTLSHIRYTPYIHDREMPGEKVYVADPAEGVKGLTPQELIEDMRVILEKFFEDQQTTNLALTYFKEDGSLGARYYIKLNSGPQRFMFIRTRFPCEEYEQKICYFSSEKIHRKLKKIDPSQEGRLGFWRDRVLFAAASCPNILDVSFIPARATVSQALYVKRLKRSEDPSSCKVYSHVCGRTEFLLPVEDPCKVFNLKKMSIAATTQKLEVENLEKIQTVLSYFLQDSHAKGIGLTFIDKEEKTVHYVWLKGLFRRPDKENINPSLC